MERQKRDNNIGSFVSEGYKRFKNFGFLRKKNSFITLTTAIQQSEADLQSSGLFHTEGFTPDLNNDCKFWNCPFCFFCSIAIFVKKKLPHSKLDVLIKL
jgi:hypothetical protein